MLAGCAAVLCVGAASCDRVRSLVGDGEPSEMETFEIGADGLEYGYAKREGEGLTHFELEWEENLSEVPDGYRRTVAIRRATESGPLPDKYLQYRYVVDARGVEPGTEVEARRRPEGFLEQSSKALHRGEEAAAGVTERATAVAKVAGTRPALWRVEEGGGALYVLGTHHCLDVSVEAVFSGAIERAFREAEVVVGEVDMSRAQGFMMQNMATYTNADSRLDRTLSDAQWEKLVSTVEGRVPANALRTMEPWLAQVMLEQRCVRMDTLKMDQFLQAKAQTEDKEVVALETPEEQFDALREAVDLESLKWSLDHKEKVDAYRRKITEAYKRGEVERIDRLFRESMEMGPNAEKTKRVLLDDRTERWMPAIREHLEGDADVLLLVGAGHVVGEKGILARLRDEGHEVERLQ